MELPPHTQAALVAHLPRDLATIAHQYMMPLGLMSLEIAYSGHGELCNSNAHIDDIAIYACRNGYPELLHVMFRNPISVKMWTLLHCAAGYGQIECVHVLIEHGANDWDCGFRAAQQGNHKDIMMLMSMMSDTRPGNKISNDLDSTVIMLRG